MSAAGLMAAMGYCFKAAVALAYSTAITGGVGALVGIDMAVAIGGAIAVAISPLFLLRFDDIRRLD